MRTDRQLQATGNGNRIWNDIGHLCQLCHDTQHFKEHNTYNTLTTGISGDSLELEN